MTGQWANMGKTAVVEAGSVTIILTENRTAPWDIGHVVSVGFNPKDYKIIVVKSAVAWKTAFGSIAKQEIYLDTPGSCSANLHHFTYKKLHRPIYPLDQI
jgi:microcystin degradation protein MlrC